MTTQQKICTDRVLPRDLNRPQHTIIIETGGQVLIRLSCQAKDNYRAHNNAGCTR